MRVVRFRLHPDITEEDRALLEDHHPHNTIRIPISSREYERECNQFLLALEKGGYALVDGIRDYQLSQIVPAALATPYRNVARRLGMIDCLQISEFTPDGVDLIFLFTSPKDALLFKIAVSE